MAYPYPKGEHMGAVGAQICEYNRIITELLQVKKKKNPESKY